MTGASLTRKHFSLAVQRSSADADRPARYD